MPPEGDESDSADLDEAFEHLRAERLARVGTQRLHEQLPVPSLAHRPQARSHPPGEKCSRKAAWRGRGTPKPPLINLSPHQSQPNGHARPAPTRVRRPVPRPAPRPAQRPAPPQGQEQGSLHRSPQASGKDTGRPRRRQAPPSVPRPHARTMMAAREQKGKGGPRAGRKPPSRRYRACAEAGSSSPGSARPRGTLSSAQGRSGMACQYACAVGCAALRACTCGGALQRWRAAMSRETGSPRASAQRCHCELVLLPHEGATGPCTPSGRGRKAPSARCVRTYVFCRV